MKKFLSLLMMTLLTTAAWAGTVTIDLTAQGYTNAAEVTTVTQDGITLTFDKGTNNNTPKWYDTGSAVRLYGGGTLTVTAAENITSIVFTLASGGTDNLSADTGTYSNGTWSGSAASVVFTQGDTKGHVRIQKVEVTTGGSGEITFAAPTILINGETPRASYSTEELPLSLSITSNNGTENPYYQYSLMANHISASTIVNGTVSLELGDNEVRNLKEGSNTLYVCEAVGESREASNWASVTFTIAEPVKTVAAFNALEDNTSLTYYGELTVVGQTGSYLYAQDETKGMLIYGNAGQTYQLGDIIPAGWSGTKVTFNGAPEMKNPSGLAAATQNVVPTPVELTPAEVNLDNFGRYAVIKGATVSDDYIVVGEESVKIYGRFNVAAPTDTEGKTYDIIGVCGYYNAVQFMPLSYEEVQQAEPLVITIEPATTEDMTFDEPVTVTITTNYDDADIEYSLNGEKAVPYTRPFTLYTTTTVAVTAMSEEADDVVETTATYTINLPAIAAEFTPAAGTYTEVQNVKVNITNTYGDVEVSYYLDDEQVEYNEETGIEVAESATLKVEVLDERLELATFTADYVINLPAKNTISYVAPEHVTMSVALEDGTPVEDKVTRVAEGTKVIITAEAEEGYTITSVKVVEGEATLEVVDDPYDGEFTAPRRATGDEVELTDEGNNTYSFIMPAEPVDIKVEVEKNLEKNFVSYVAPEHVTMSVALEDGTPVEDKVTRVAEGTKVIITAEAEEGYTITSVKVVEGDVTLERDDDPFDGEFGAPRRAVGDEVELTDEGNNTYSFIMPAEGVDIKVEVVEDTPVGITDINAAGNSGVKYVNVKGQVSDRPFEGINIVIDGNKVTKIVK